jgi:hypothetical protein
MRTVLRYVFLVAILCFPEQVASENGQKRDENERAQEKKGLRVMWRRTQTMTRRLTDTITSTIIIVYLCLSLVSACALP